MSRVIAAILCALVWTALPASAATPSLKEIRQAGVVIQEWDTSCAAAALATVLTYAFHDPATESEVARGLLHQTKPLKVRYRGGFSMLDMKRYVEERGYEGIGFRGMTLDDIRYFEAPIVALNLHGYHHYVVFKGLMPDGDVWVADPAFGNRTFSKKKFEDVWMNGITFVLLRKDTK